MNPISFNPGVEKLLAESQLPFDDLRGSDIVTLLGHEQQGQLVGLVGLECYGSDALLRSLVIAPFARGTGLSVKLVSYAERQAVESGVQSLYILTTTAERFFKRLGYNVIDRNGAPKTIASTSQFSGLCPSTAAFMVKQL
jgi:amino-acid N-acetyltransferase